MNIFHNNLQTKTDKPYFLYQKLTICVILINLQVIEIYHGR